jgi:hypothetical protein
MSPRWLWDKTHMNASKTSLITAVILLSCLSKAFSWQINLCPVNLINNLGTSASFSVNVVRDSPDELLSYQWSLNGALLHNQTNTSIIIANVCLTNIGYYTFSVNGLVACGTTLSAITSPPVSTTVSPGGVAKFTASISSGEAPNPPFTYQWWFNGWPSGTPITDVITTDATTVTLTIPSVSRTNIGGYAILFKTLAGMPCSSYPPVRLATVDITMFAGVAGVSLDGQLGAHYLIQSKSNFLSDWATVTNVALPTQPYIFTDYNTPWNTQQFYRAVPQ